MERTKIGIDVSKLSLDCYDPRTAKTENIQNEASAIKDYLSRYCKSSCSLIVEPTGTYSDKICELATSLGYEVLMANPSQSSHYMKVLNIQNKTDKASAKSLSSLASVVKLPKYEGGKQKRKQLMMVYNSLKKQAQSIKNQLESLEQYLAACLTAKKSLQQVLLVVEKEIEKIEGWLHELTSVEEQNFYKLASSVVGIGKHSAHGLLHYTNGLKDFENSNQLSKFIGIAPSKHYSGTSVRKKGRISKNGPSRLRACLYNAAKSAKRFNHACKALYDRMKENGKPHKVAMIAIVRKLLRQVFAVVKKGIPFDNQRFLTQNLIQAK